MTTLSQHLCQRSPSSPTGMWRFMKTLASPSQWFRRWDVARSHVALLASCPTASYDRSQAASSSTADVADRVDALIYERTCP